MLPDDYYSMWNGQIFHSGSWILPEAESHPKNLIAQIQAHTDFLEFLNPKHFALFTHPSCHSKLTNRNISEESVHRSFPNNHCSPQMSSTKKDHSKVHMTFALHSESLKHKWEPITSIQVKVPFWCHCRWLLSLVLVIKWLQKDYFCVLFMVFCSFGAW